MIDQGMVANKVIHHTKGDLLLRKKWGIEFAKWHLPKPRLKYRKRSELEKTRIVESMSSR